MKRWWLVSAAAAVVCVPAHGVGGAGAAPGLGLGELATALGLEAPAAVQQGTVGQAEGGGVGLLEQVRTSLGEQQIPGTGVGMPARLGVWMAAKHAEETAGAATHAQLQQFLSGGGEAETAEAGTNEAAPDTETGEPSELSEPTPPSPPAPGGMAYALAERMAVQKATQAAGAGAHAQLQEGLAEQMGLGPAAGVQEQFRHHLMRRAGVQ